MKAMSMLKRFASLLALLLAVMMIFAACGPDNETPKPTGDDADVSSEETVESNESKTEETESKKENSSKKKESSKKEDKEDAPAGSYTGFSESTEKGGSMYKNAPKGEVHVLMWRNYHKSEQLLIDQYEKLTGVKVKTTVSNQNDYPTKLVTMVSGNESPDVVMFQSNYFPGLVTKSLQPLKNKYFQLDSDCWNKAYMDAYKIYDNYFGVAMPASWSCEDCTYVTYYSPAVLQNCGIKEDPYELYKNGLWNWDKQIDIIRAVKAKGLTGLALQSNDMFMLSAGKDFVKYENNTYTNMLDNVTADSLLTEAWMKVAELNGEDCLVGWDIASVQQGKVGLFTAISYGLYNEGNWFTNDFAKTLKAVPVAGPTGGTAYTPVRPKVWGVPKKAKNPEGAAYFLRYFLDVSEFNQDTTFHNDNFKEVYKTITDSKAPKTVMHGSGVCDYVNYGTYTNICNDLTATIPANITTQIKSKAKTVNAGIGAANKDLARLKPKSKTKSK